MNRTIKILGKGSMCFTTDLLKLQITLKSADTSYRKAMEYHCEKIAKLINCLEELGFGKDDVISVMFTTDRISDFNLVDNESYSKGIKVTQKFKVCMPFDIPRLEQVIHKVMDCGIEPEIWIVQAVSDVEGLRKKLLQTIIKESEEKAKVMAEAAGAKLGNVVNMQYKIKEFDYEGYISNDYFDSTFIPITAGYLFGYDFIPDELSAQEEIEIEWELI